MPSKRPASVSSKKPSSGPGRQPTQDAEPKSPAKSSKKRPKLSPPKSPDLAVEPDAASARKSHRRRRAREFPDAEGGGQGKGPQQIQRVWTDEDVVALLRGAVEFRARTGSAPTAPNMAGFFASVKNSLPPQITQEQVYNKLRHLRHRHLQGGGPGTHGPVVQSLIDRLWSPEPKSKLANDISPAGKEEDEDDDGGRDGDGDDEADEDEEVEGDVPKVYPYLVDAVEEYSRQNGASSALMVAGLPRADPAKAKILEEKWRRHWQADMKLKARQLELSGKLHDMLAAAQKGSSS